MIDAAAGLSVLIGIAGEDFIRIPRIDQNAGEVTEWKIATPPRPGATAVLRHVERLLRSDIDERRTRRILNDHIHRRSRRNPTDLLPRIAGIARHQHT